MLRNLVTIFYGFLRTFSSSIFNPSCEMAEEPKTTFQYLKNTPHVIAEIFATETVSTAVITRNSYVMLNFVAIRNVASVK